MANRLAIVFVMSVLGGCNTISVSPTGPRYPARSTDCRVEMLTTVPSSGFVEIGTIDVNGNNLANDLEGFHDQIQDKVCEAGGDAAIAMANGHGYYIKATILRAVAVDATPTEAAPAHPAAAEDLGCHYDTQCKGERICVDGRCQDPAQPSPPAVAQ